MQVVWANEDHAWHDCENASVLVTVKRPFVRQRG